LFVAVVFSLLWAAPSVCRAEIHAGCAKCKKFVKISDDGAGFARNVFILCPDCLSRCSDEQKEKYMGLSDEKKKEYERKRQDFEDRFKKADAAYKDYEAKRDRRDDATARKSEELKKVRDAAETGIKTYEQLTKDLLDDRKKLVEQIPAK